MANNVDGITSVPPGEYKYAFGDAPLGNGVVQVFVSKRKDALEFFDGVRKGGFHVIGVTKNEAGEFVVRVSVDAGRRATTIRFMPLDLWRLNVTEKMIVHDPEDPTIHLS